MNQTIKRTMTKKQKRVLVYVVRLINRKRFYEVLPEIKENKEWDFYRYWDHGKRSTDAKCATCGTTLRHEFVVKNKKTKEKMTLGSNCLVKKLNIPEHLADKVFQPVEYIKYDLKELKNKYINGFELDPYLKKHLGMIHLPKEIKMLIDAGLPLLDEQLHYLDKHISSALEKKKREGKMYIGCYEIKSRTLFEVATGEIDADHYFRSNFSNEIFDLINKHRKSYVPDYDIINHLVKNGMPNEIAFGQHILLKPLRKYLSKQNGIQVGTDYDGFIYFKMK